MKQRSGTPLSRDGRTTGLTLRLSVGLLELCAKIAARANLMSLRKGGIGQVTAQDVMRHHLNKLEKRFRKNHARRMVAVEHGATMTRGEND